jgi:hypothetical protein
MSMSTQTSPTVASLAQTLAITEENDTPQIIRIALSLCARPLDTDAIPSGDNALCDGALSPVRHALSDSTFPFGLGREERTSPAEPSRSSEAPHHLAGSAMLPEENSGRAEHQVPRVADTDSRSLHETPAQPSSSDPSALLSEAQSLRYAERLSLWEAYQALAARGLSQVDAARQLGVSNTKLSRMAKQVAAHGLDGLKDRYHNCGRNPSLTFTDEEFARLGALYLKTNRTADAGSMQTACKFFALEPQTREEIRTAILSSLERGRLPRFATRALKRITREHFAAHRKPGSLATDHFSGRRGTFARDKMERRRVVESDDGTLNFAAWIPWPQGGDPISDKYGVRLGRWQFLPALEAGWSQYYLGYTLVARPKGTYTQEDVRALIAMVVSQHGLPDAFRFERGTWESNSVVDLLQRLSVDLDTVWQSNQKPYIEGGFNTLWTYLSMIDGQVGRFRGEMEKENLLIEKCRAGRLDPRDQFPGLTECTRALDGALAMRNADRRHSKIYGSWIPEVRYREHQEQEPWRQLPSDLAYLFAPVVKEWTVAKGTVGNSVTLTDDLKVPFYFTHDDLWRMNGEKVRVYFDPAAENISATIVALTTHAGFAPGNIVCQASLLGDIPHYARAAMGWSREPLNATRTAPSNRAPLAAVRREVRALSPNGRIKSSVSEERDGRGNVSRMERGESRAQTPAPAPARTAERRTLIPAEVETLEISERRIDAAPSDEPIEIIEM